MGDCDLAEVKRRHGARIGLMGNLHTTDVVLKGTPEVVRNASKWCIDVAAEGGGFILSTGDQVGRDTPDENVYAMIEAAHDFGVY
jgi:uroporphyrinogen decarboxylase